MARLFSAFLLLVSLGSCDFADENVSEVDQDASHETLSKGQPVSEVICHRNVPGGSYTKKTVPKTALSGHLRHGDGQPGDMIPEVDGMEFDASCQSVPSPCVCWSSNELERLASKPDGYIISAGSPEFYYAYIHDVSDQVRVDSWSAPNTPARICSYRANSEWVRIHPNLTAQETSSCFQSILDTGIPCYGNLCPNQCDRPNNLQLSKRFEPELDLTRQRSMMRTIFFYGLFMDSKLLQQMGFDPEVVGPAELRDYRIRIGNKATLVAHVGSCSCGLVMRLP